MKVGDIGTITFKGESEPSKVRVVSVYHDLVRVYVINGPWKTSLVWRSIRQVKIGV